MNWFNKKNVQLQVWQCRHFETLEQQLMWKGKFDSSFILKTVKGATSFFFFLWRLIVYHFNQLHSFLSVHFDCPGWYLYCLFVLLTVQRWKACSSDLDNSHFAYYTSILLLCSHFFSKVSSSSSVVWRPWHC